MKSIICFNNECLEGSVTRLGNMFLPGEGDYAVYECSCGELILIPIYDLHIDMEMAILNVNLTFEA